MRTSLDQPCVAVIIAAYNARDTLPEAVRSALAQPEVAEVCVVDDVSTDDTFDVARSIDGSARLKVIRQPVNRGPAAARNRAIDETTAPFLAVLDADDYLLPGRMAALLAHRGEAEFIGDDLLRTVADQTGEPAAAWNIKAPVKIGFTDFVERNVSRYGADRAELGFLKPLMSRAFLDSHGLRYREELRLGEDFDLYARALASGARMIMAPAAGYVSVTRAESLSSRHSELDLVRLRDASALLARLRDFTPAERLALDRHYASLECKIQWLRLIEAVKARRFPLILRPFFNRRPVPGYLAARLGEQLLERTGLRRERS